MHYHGRKNGLVSHVTLEWLGIVLTFLFRTCCFVMFTVAHPEVLNSVRSEEYVGVLPAQESLGLHCTQARREAGQKSGKQIGRDETQSKVLSFNTRFLTEHACHGAIWGRGHH